MSSTLSRSIAAIGHVAAKGDGTRPSLEGVHVTQDYTEATDGHILLRGPAPGSDTEADDKHDIAGDYAAAAWAKLKPPKRGPFVVRRVNGALETDTARVPVLPDVTWPNTGQLFDKLDPPLVRIGLTCAVLKKLLKALPDCQGLTLTVTATGTKEYTHEPADDVPHATGPLVLEAHDRNGDIITGLVMPRCPTW